MVGIAGQQVLWVGRETVVTKSPSKKELDPGYAVEPEAAPLSAGAVVPLEVSTRPARRQEFCRAGASTNRPPSDRSWPWPPGRLIRHC